jgi:hypothetical protein
VRYGRQRRHARYPAASAAAASSNVSTLLRLGLPAQLGRQ